MRIRIEGPRAAELAARAAEEGLRIAGDGEEADLVAREAPAETPPRPAVPSPPKPLPRAPRGLLSRRETEILEYLVDGWSNAEIASALRIGVRTVRFHLEAIYAKLGATRRGEAVREAVRLGLVRFDT